MRHFRKFALVLSIVLVTQNIFGQGWTVNPADYSFSGEVDAIVIHGVSEVTTGTLGAFVGGTCRGFVAGTFFPPTGKTVFLLICYSNLASGETLTFKYFDPSNSTIYDISETEGFVSNMQLGNALTPLQFHTVPLVFAVTGGGSYCQGGSGVAVGLSDSESGVTYSLIKDGSATGTTLSGTGSPISFGNQIAGTYTVSGTNSGGTILMTGSAVNVAIITPAPTASVTAQPTCSVPTGTIVITAPTGASYEYNMDAGAYQSSTTFSGVAVGNHTLTTRQVASPFCVSSSSGTLTVNAAPTLPSAPTASVTIQPTCAVPTGTIVVSAPTGAAYQYNMDGGAYQSSVTFAGVSVGNHTLTTRLAASPTCISGLSGTLTVNAVPTVPSAPTASVTVQPTCAVPTGTIVVSAPTGAAYEYNMDGGAYQSSVTFAGVSAGNHTLTTRLSASPTCISGSSGTVTVNAAPGIPAVPTASVTVQPTCAVPTGTIVITAPISASYEYNMDGGAYQSGTTFSGVGVGNHTLTTRVIASPTCVSGSSGTLTVNAVPTIPSAPTASVTIQPTCAVPTGTIVVSAPTGAAYQYNMDGGAYQSSVTFAGVSVGNHTLTTRLAASPTCISGLSGTLTVNAVPTVPSAPTASVTVQPTCAVPTGTIVVSAPTGAAYEYNMDGGAYQSSVTFAGVSAGNHTLTTRLSASPTCISGSSGTVTVNAAPGIPAVPTASVTVQPTCAVPTGTIVITAPISASYEYNMDGGAYQSGTTFSGVGVGNHTLTTRVIASPTCVSGSSGTLTVNAVPTIPSAPTASVTIQPTCAVPTGTILVTAPTGASYEYNLDGGTYQSSVTFAGVSVGNHTLTTRLAASPTCISGSSGTLTVNAVPTVPSAPTASVTVQPTCAVPTGTIVVTAPTGAAYEYNMDGGVYQSSVTFAGVSAGNHTLTTRLSASPTCMSGSSGSLTVNAAPGVPAVPTASVTVQPTCVIATGTIVITAPTGAAYEYNMDGGTYQSGTTFAGVAAGNHTLTARLIASPTCVSGSSGTLTVNAQPQTPIVNNQTTTISSGATFIVTPSGGTIPVGTTYTWIAPVLTGGVTGGVAQGIPQANVNGTLTIASGSGTAVYTVTPTSAAGCIGATFTVTVTVNSTCSPVSITTQPGNSSICSTSGIASFTVVPNGTGPFTYQWQYFNGSSFVNVVNGTPAGAVYTNATTATMSVAGITTPSTYQYHCFLTNCSGGNNIASNAGTLTVLGLPIPTLSSSDPDNTFCLGTSVTFTAGGGGVGANYDFRVQGITMQTGLITTYTTTSLGNGQVVTVNVTNSAGCSALSAGITNIVNQPPFIYISTPAACSTDFATYSVGVTVGSGTVTCNNLLAVVVPAGVNIWTINLIPAGVNVIITVTDISGCQNMITVTAPNCLCPVVPAPTSGGNRSYCTGGVIPTLTATVLAGETVDWYDSSSGGNQLLHGNINYTPTGPGTYYAMARNTTSNCVSSTRTPIVLTMNPLPIPTLTSSDADNIFCAGTSITFTASGGTNYNFFVGGVSQQNGALATYTTTTLTNGQAVNVTVTNANGCTATAGPITNTVNPSPTPTLSSSDADNIFCAGTSVIFTAGGGATYDFRVGGISQQNGASTTYTTSLLTNGQIVNVIVSNANGCSSASPSITNTVNPVPTPTLTSSDADNIFCAGTSVVFTAGGGTNYNFRVGGVSVQNSISNIYTTTTLTNSQVVDVIVSNSVGCPVTSASITNTVNPQPAANAGTGGDVCGLSFNLSAHPSIGIGTWTKTSGTGTASFTPNASSPNATVTVSEYGTYTFTWTEVSGSCTGSSVVTVNFYLQPVANAGTGGNNCGTGFRFNATLNAGIGTWTKVSGPGTVIFSPDANTANALATVSAFGSYTFRWSVNNGTCSNSATVAVVFIQQASAIAGSGGNSCDKTFTLSALVPATGTGTWTKSVGPGNATFTPDNHQANAKVTVDQFGTYSFAWTVVNSTCTSSDIVQVIFHNLPPINAGRDTAFCKGGSVQLHAVGTGTVSWTPVALVNNPNIINPIATPDITTTFTVNLTDQFGCKNSDNIVVEVRDKIVADAGPDQILGYLFTTTMNANLAHSYETGVWSLLSGTGKFLDSTDAKTEVNSLSVGKNKFQWTVSNGYCPSSFDSVLIEINDFIIPTLITPNMDGKNDYFVLRGLTTLGKTELIIFDRRGAMVYKNLNYDNSWNGVDYNKNPLPDDTYFYVIKTLSGKSISGYIVIRR